MRHNVSSRRRQSTPRPPPTLTTLIGELAELPEGLHARLPAGLLVLDVLECVGHDRAQIARVLGIDTTALERAITAVRPR